MPYTASLKGLSRTILAGLAKSEDSEDIEEGQPRLLSIALGVSIPTDDTVVSKFRGEEFGSIAHLFANTEVDISTHSKKVKMLNIQQPVAWIGDSVQRFVLAGFDSEGLPSLEQNETLTSSDVAENAAAFEKHKMAFLQKANAYQDAAMKLATKWQLDYEEALANYKIVSYDALRQDVLFQAIYDYIETCFKTNSSFQKQVLSDAKQFVERISERSQQTLTRPQKAIIRYHSVLHFLEQAAVFNVLWGRYRIDAFAYPGEEISTHAELKKVEHHQKIVEIIQVEIPEFKAEKPTATLVIGTKKENSPRNGSFLKLTPSNSNKTSPTATPPISGEGSPQSSSPVGFSVLDDGDEEKQLLSKINRKRTSSNPKTRVTALPDISHQFPHSFSGVQTEIPRELLDPKFLKEVQKFTNAEDPVTRAQVLGAFYGAFFAQKQPKSEKLYTASSSQPSSSSQPDPVELQDAKIAYEPSAHQSFPPPPGQ